MHKLQQEITHTQVHTIHKLQQESTQAPAHTGAHTGALTKKKYGWHKLSMSKKQVLLCGIEEKTVDTKVLRGENRNFGHISCIH